MTDQSTLPQALDAFEEQLETPIIPGELPTWAAGVRKASRAAVAALKEHVPTWHKPIFEQIIREDSDLLTTVQQLRDDEAEIVKTAKKLDAESKRIAAKAKTPAAEGSDSTECDKAIQKFIDQGLAWIIQIRKQEAALTTWFQEAFNRDTGVAG